MSNMKTEAHELVFIVGLGEGTDLGSALSFLREVAEEIKENPDVFVDELEYHIEEIARKHELCPECFSHMAYNRVGRELIGEFWGTPAYEDRYVLQCPECGYEEE